MGRKGAEIITRVINGKEEYFKVCNTCRDLVNLGNYKKDKTCVGGKAPRCKDCDKIVRASQKDAIRKKNQRYYRENKEKILQDRREYLQRPETKEVLRKWLDKNREVLRKKKREYRENNKDKIQAYEDRIRERKKAYEKVYRANNPNIYKAKRLRRRAAIENLPNTLTADDIDEIMKEFNYSCALTGEKENIHLDHFITLSTGCVGTVYENMVPLRNDLNSSKQDKNPFVWFYENEKRYNLSARKFQSLVKYLAQLNNMTVAEYEAHVFNCYELRRRGNG